MIGQCVGTVEDHPWVQLLHVSDLHCRRDPDARVYGQPSDTTLESVLAAAGTHRNLDAVVCTGDVADDGSAAAYQRVADRLRATAPVTAWVPGNHDVAATMRGLAPSGFPYALSLGSWRLLLLDSCWPGHNEGQVGPWQLDWLDRALLTSTQPTLVALHHPPLPACQDPECQLRDADTLLEVLDAHANLQAVLTGHNHRAFATARGHTQYLGAPSTCRQAHHDPPRHAWTNEVPAGRVITLHPDGTIDHEVLPTNQPASLRLTWQDEQHAP